MNKEKHPDPGLPDAHKKNSTTPLTSASSNFDKSEMGWHRQGNRASIYFS